MVTISEVRTDQCDWCCKTDEGVRAKFKEGLSGFFCRKCFWQAAKARATPEETNAESSPGRGAA